MPESSRQPLSGGRLVLVIAIAAFAAGICLLLAQFVMSTVAAGAFAASGALDAKSAISAGKSGDVAGASADIGSAQSSMNTAQALVSQPAFDAMSVVPGLSTLSNSVADSINAGANLTAAAGNGIDLLATVNGSDGNPPAFSNGSFDLARLPSMGPSVKKMNDSLAASEAYLSEISSAPGFSQVKAAALEKVTPMRDAVSVANAAWPNLPDALGGHGQKQYLVAILNPAELFPTGGAPLSAMLLRFNNGKMTIPLSGQVSSDIFPAGPNGPAQISWQHIAGKPYYSSRDAKSLFVNSNLYPDFTVSGEEMARAWQAGGEGHIDGVIAIDTTAIAAILNKTGPVQLTNGTQLTGDNLGQKVLIDAYQNSTGEQNTQRHDENNQLMAALQGRMKSMQSLPQVASALLGVAPGRHFQVYMRNPKLTADLAGLDVNGGLSPGTGDYFGVYTTSSPNKVAVYQQRSIDREVRLQPDGSASVTEQIKVTNAAPPTEGAPLTGFGYTDRRAINRYVVYVPDKSQQARLTVSGGVPGSVRPQPTYRDAAGRTFLESVSSADPGQTALLTVTYNLPAGTFSDGSNSLKYVSTADPQPMWTVPTITVHVIAPAGYSARGEDGWTQDGDNYSQFATLDQKRTFTLSLNSS